MNIVSSLLNDGKFFSLEVRSGNKYIGRVRRGFSVQRKYFTFENVKTGRPVTVKKKNVVSLTRKGEQYARS